MEFSTHDSCSVWLSFSWGLLWKRKHHLHLQNEFLHILRYALLHELLSIQSILPYSEFKIRRLGTGSALPHSFSLANQRGYHLQRFQSSISPWDANSSSQHILGYFKSRKDRDSRSNWLRYYHKALFLIASAWLTSWLQGNQRWSTHSSACMKTAVEASQLMALIQLLCHWKTSGHKCQSSRKIQSCSQELWGDVTVSTSRYQLEIHSFLRYNLDPLNQHIDMEIWRELERCRMKDAVSYYILIVRLLFKRSLAFTI